MTATATEAVFAYHERSKHHLRRFAASPGHLDWATQPDPYRRFGGAPQVELPLAQGLEARWDDVLTPGAVQPRPLDAGSLGGFLELALGLTAWKQLGRSRWALRANPSSGNLHPTECYLLVPALPGLTAGLQHYLSETHALEGRCRVEGGAAAPLRDLLPTDGFLVGLTSIRWREAWKYGERAFRYCQHDVGHAIGALRIAAAALGWSALVLDEVADETIEALLGLDRGADFDGAERESAELVMALWPGDAATAAAGLDADAVRELKHQRWHGKANRLSAGDPVPWEAIDRVAAASRKG